MRKRIVGFLACVLASAVMASLMFSGIVIGPQPQPPSPQFDVNVKNTPLPVDLQNTPLPVEVTNPIGMPIATNCSYIDFSGAGAGVPYDLELLEKGEATDVGDKTVVFTGGSLSGSIAFTSEDGAGGATPAGIVVVEPTTGYYIGWTLPFSSTFRVEHVNRIILLVSFVRPQLRGYSSYYFYVTASVFWFIEE